MFCPEINAEKIIDNNDNRYTAYNLYTISDSAKAIMNDTLKYHRATDYLFENDSVIYPNKYFMPIFFFGKLEPSDFSVKEKDVVVLPYNFKEHKIEWLESEIETENLRKLVYSRLMAQNPYIIAYDWRTLPKPPKKEKFKANLEKSLIYVPGPEIVTESLGLGIPKPNIWQIKMNSSVTFSQNYVSDNGYQGGESNINILSIQNMAINRYDETGKTEFKTVVDLKTGFYTTPSDTMRTFRVNENLFQVNSKFTVQAIKKWSYAFSTNFKTQVFNNYKSNTDELLSQFLSPGELNLNVGMNYSSKALKNKIDYSLMLAPLAYNLKFVLNIDEIDETRFGIEEGHKALNQVGSSVEGKLSWKMSQNIKWDSRLYFFTNYHVSQGNFENTFNFSINKFLTTKIYLHLRYDDDTKDEKKFQFKELLTFGFEYAW